jgi:hypothetical protein
LTWDRLNYGPPTTVWETIGHMTKKPGHVTPVKPADHLRLIRRLPQGEALRHLWEEENPPETHVRASYGVMGRPRMFVHRLYADRPMGAITGDYFIHPFQDRFLGKDELKVLNSFPDDWQFAGKPHGWASEIARGVCPSVAEFIARHAARAIREGGEDRGNTYLVDLRTPNGPQLKLASPSDPLPTPERPRIRVPALSRPAGAVDPLAPRPRRGRPPKQRDPAWLAARTAAAERRELVERERRETEAQNEGKFSYADMVELLKSEGREPPTRR